MKNRWKVNLWILWFTHLTVLMCFSLGFPFLPLYVQEIQPMSRETLTYYTSILSSVPAIAMGIMAPIWGYIADRYGRKLMLLRATGTAVILLTLMGFVTSVHQLIVLRALQGIFTGTITAVMAFVASDAPEEDLSFALSVITSATFIGWSIGPMMGSIFANNYGYRASFKIGGAIMFLSFLVVLFFVKEDKKKFKARRKEKRVPIIKAYRSVLNPTVIAVLSLLFLLRIVRTVFSPYFPIFVSDFFTESNEITKFTGFTDGIRSLFTAVSCYIIGIVSKKVNGAKLFGYLVFASIFVSSLFTIQAINGNIFGAFEGILNFAIFYVLYFTIIGGSEPLITAIAAQNVDADNRGALFGLQGTVGSMAWFMGPVIGGPIAFYNGVQYVLIVIPIGLLTMLLIKRIANKHLV